MMRDILAFFLLIIFYAIQENLYFDFQGAGCQQVLEKQCKVKICRL
jgi:hypothetical protein